LAHGAGAGADAMGVAAMIELLRTNDLVLISVIEAIFDEHRVPYFVADQHMSAVEGSTGFLRRRIMVAADEAGRARRLLREAGLGEELQ
jgi:hypothetical protein